MAEWDTLQAIYRTRGPATRAFHKNPPPFQQLIDEFEVPPHLFGEFVYMCENYNVQSMTAEHYLRRNCYYLPAQVEHTLEEIAAAGLLSAADEVGKYYISEKGLRFFKRVDDVLRPRWVIMPVEGEDLTQVLTLLRRVVKETISGTLPCDDWSVRTRATYGYKVLPDAPALQRLNEITFDLWAYRDDAHLAAWREPYPDLSPRTWEALSVLWKKEATDAATLAEALKDHGFTVDDYAESLRELVARGWVGEADGVYSLTEVGEKVRQRAESLTDEYFYTVFSVLSAADRTELNTAMDNVLASLKALVAAS